MIGYTVFWIITGLLGIVLIFNFVLSVILSRRVKYYTKDRIEELLLIQELGL